MDILKVPLNFLNRFKPVALEDLLLAQFTSYLPAWATAKNAPLLLPVYMAVVVVFFEVGCVFTFAFQDLRRCLAQSPAAYKKTYIFCLCILAFLMFIFCQWAKESIARIYTSTLKTPVVDVFNVFDGLLKALAPFLPTNSWASFLILLRALIKAPDFKGFIASFFKEQGVPAEDANSGIVEFQQIIARQKQPENLMWGSVKNAVGSLWFLNVLDQCFSYLTGSGSFSASWGEHLDSVRTKIGRLATHIETSTGLVTNRGTFERNIKDQLPTVDFIRLFLGSVSSLQLELIESMKRLCFTPASVGAGMPLQRFDRRAPRGTVKFAATAFHGNKRKSSNRASE